MALFSPVSHYPDGSVNTTWNQLQVVIPPPKDEPGYKVSPYNVGLVDTCPPTRLRASNYSAKALLTNDLGVSSCCNGLTQDLIGEECRVPPDQPSERGLTHRPTIPFRVLI